MNYNLSSNKASNNNYNINFYVLKISRKKIILLIFNINILYLMYFIFCIKSIHKYKLYNIFSVNSFRNKNSGY